MADGKITPETISQKVEQVSSRLGGRTRDARAETDTKVAAEEMTRDTDLKEAIMRVREEINRNAGGQGMATTEAERNLVTQQDLANRRAKNKQK